MQAALSSTAPVALPSPFWPPGRPATLPPPQHTLWQALAASAERSPAKPAIVFYDSVLRYAQLVQQAEALAGYLQQRLALAADDRVLLLAQNCPQAVAAYYAVQRADAVVVPANAMCTEHELDHLLADSGAALAIVAPELLPRLATALTDGRLRGAIVLRYADALTQPSQVPVPEFVTTDPAWPALPAPVAARLTRWADALAAGERPHPHRASVHRLCVLPYTSGTTGRPKGCRHSHATVGAALQASAAWRGLHAGSVFLAVAPLFHMLGMQNGMNLPLSLGSTIVMLPRWDREAALSLIERYRVSVWGAPPPMLVDFFANPRVQAADLSCLAALFGGGAAMPDAVAAMLRSRYGLHYQEGYGMTETASFLHGNPPQRVKPGTLGLPSFGVESIIVDPDTLAPLPAGQTGELLTRGPQLMLGYWRNEAADAEAFVTIAGRRFLRTGDLAYVDDEGYFVMRDRLKRMINVSGYKVWPAEVENQLYAHPAILEACVIATPDPRSGEAVKAVVVCRPGMALTAEALVAWCREHLAAYKIPRVVAFAAALPKSNTGKIQWRELQEQEHGVTAPGDPSCPNTPPPSS